ncbi:MAG: hypothetical protein U0790_00295 [Isosphaeraceae bacterium]
MIAHICLAKDGSLAFSGRMGDANPRVRTVCRVEVGHDYVILSDGQLQLPASSQAPFALFTAEALVVAARNRMFGMKIVEDCLPRAGVEPARPEPMAARPGKPGAAKGNTQASFGFADDDGPALGPYRNWA